MVTVDDGGFGGIKCDEKGDGHKKDMLSWARECARNNG